MSNIVNEEAYVTASVCQSHVYEERKHNVRTSKFSLPLHFANKRLF